MLPVHAGRPLGQGEDGLHIPKLLADHGGLLQTPIQAKYIAVGRDDISVIPSSMISINLGVIPRRQFQLHKELILVISIEKFNNLSSC